MKKSAVVIFILLIACVVMFMTQRQMQATLRQQNDLLRAQLEQLQSDNQRLSSSVAQAQPSPPPDDQSRELARLRNEVGQLRQQTNALGKLPPENYRPPSETAAAATPVQPLSPADAFQLDQFHRLDALKQLGLAMHIFASNNNDRFATNFDQLNASLDGATNFGGGITLDSFEFMNSGLTSPETPELLIFREKTARQTLDGKWMRIYGMADGSVQTRVMADDNFDDYEIQHSPPPPTQ